MGNASLRDCQLMQFEILKECKRVCDLAKIPYFLHYGTLIGAVCYGGFVPWDDDIDISIPADKVDDFRNAFLKHGSDRFFLQDIYTEKEFPYIWMKIRMNDTCSMPVKYKDAPINWGICIDIFPLFYAGENKMVLKFKQKAYKFAGKIANTFLYPYEKNLTMAKKVFLCVPKGFRKSWIKAIVKMLSRKRKDSDKYLCDHRHLFPCDFMQEGENLSFEGEMFSVPSNYDGVLRLCYGDYTVPPPLEKQTGHSGQIGEIIWSVDKSYKYFK